MGALGDANISYRRAVGVDAGVVAQVNIGDIYASIARGVAGECEIDSDSATSSNIWIALDYCVTAGVGAIVIVGYLIQVLTIEYCAGKSESALIGISSDGYADCSTNFVRASIQANAGDGWGDGVFDYIDFGKLLRRVTCGIGNIGY